MGLLLLALHNGPVSINPRHRACRLMRRAVSLCALFSARHHLHHHLHFVLSSALACAPSLLPIALYPLPPLPPFSLHCSLLPSLYATAHSLHSPAQSTLQLTTLHCSCRRASNLPPPPVVKTFKRRLHLVAVCTASCARAFSPRSCFPPCAKRFLLFVDRHHRLPGRDIRILPPPPTSPRIYTAPTSRDSRTPSS